MSEDPWENRSAAERAEWVADQQAEKHTHIDWIDTLEDVPAQMSCRHGNTVSVEAPAGTVIHISAIQFKCGCYLRSADA